MNHLCHITFNLEIFFFLFQFRNEFYITINKKWLKLYHVRKLDYQILCTKTKFTPIFTTKRTSLSTPTHTPHTTDRVKPTVMRCIHKGQVFLCLNTLLSGLNNNSPTHTCNEQSITFTASLLWELIVLIILSSAAAACTSAYAHHQKLWPREL